jgi:hypothetical protein
MRWTPFIRDPGEETHLIAAMSGHSDERLKAS